MTDRPVWHSSPTIGVITALPVEFAAAWQVLQCRDEVHLNGRTYRIGLIQRTGGTTPHVIAIGCLNEMGNVSAAAGTMALLDDFKEVRALIVCGIAGCVPDPHKPDDDVRLGDIVVPNAQGVVQYDHESVKENQTDTRVRWYRPSRTLLAAATQLAAGERLDDRPWERHISATLMRMESARPGSSARWQRPHLASDLLVEFSAARKLDYAYRALRRLGVPKRWVAYHSIPRASDTSRQLDRPKIFHGVIASASRLQRSSRNRDLLKKQYGAIAIDMESAGVAEAASQRDLAFYTVRGATDYCNERKDDTWHEYCALAAATYVRALLEITHLPARYSASRAGPPTQTAETALPKDVASDLAGVLNRIYLDQARRMIEDISRNLDTWEFRKAFTLADGLSTWLEEHESYLPRPLLAEAYALLARVAIVGQGQNRAAALPVDTSRAEYYLGKARDATRER